MTTNAYCEKHEWPAGMGEPCPDCIALASAQAETEYFRAERDALLLQIDELRKFVDLTATLFDAGIVADYPGEPDEEPLAEDWRNGLKRLRTDDLKRVGSSPTDRPCCVEAYASGFEMGKARGEGR